MIAHFLKLEWKQFYRAASFGKSIGLKIVIAFFALYFIASFLILGITGFFAVKELFPNKDPLVVVNSFLLYAVTADLIFRFLMQKLPLINAQPLLLLNIKKSNIVHYVLVKSALSFFNIMPLFFYIPFAVVLIKEGYAVNGVLGWLFLMVMLTQASNFLNFLINKSNTAFTILVTILLGGFLIQYYQLFNLAAYVGGFFDAIYQNPIYALLSVVVVAILYRTNFVQLYNLFYLDQAVSKKVEQVKASDLSWTNKLGDVAPFIKNDLRLFWRNKRTKSSVWMLVMGLFYGVLFYPNPIYADKEYFFIL
jgi:hypothetical protein